MFPFPNPWKDQKAKGSGVFRGYKMGTLVRNGLSSYMLASETVYLQI